MSRRRLVLYSAPLCIVVLLISIKMISVVVLGGSARDDFARHDIGALDADVSWLQILDIIEPGTTAFAAGTADVLAGRLPDAEQSFTEALGHADSCPVRVNLLLVRETLGDLAFRDGQRDAAIARYRDALTVAQQAQPQCFAGNDDPDEQRRAVRADAVARLERKLALVQGPALAPPPPPPAVAPPPPPPAGATVEEPAQPDEPPEPLTLGPGDPQDLLRRLLDDANSAGDGRE
ncbi:hypothetical protein MMUR_46930 [Mycolicibacterium murale]|uniref:Tetratricopeptide repeat protein n=1 Tax=Mycolicibacterium murale TaxID=182220 RepID=A0A7I9WTN2_9MYCO|nr:hypothetical protein [Mycolicibacterium murale]MCV7186321.1 hypothetical protein [Mycolicibacterium murale]GFG60557.1 hypothetical protein MMUR_46930 [Mycolicibacterium murale]